MLALALMCCCACMPVGPVEPVAALSYCGPSPLFGAPIEVTDTSPDELTVNFNLQTTPMARVGNELVISYWVETRSAVSHTRPRHRRLNLSTLAFDAADSTDTLGQAATGNYHERPSLLRDQAGNVLILQPDTSYSPACSGLARDCVRGGILALNAAWTPARLTNGTPSSASYDFATLWDPKSNTSYFFGEMGNAGSYAWGAESVPQGLSKSFWRITGSVATAGNYDGPYVPLNAAGAQQPTISGCTTSGPGNVFAKGRPVLGVDRSTLHLLWARDLTFGICDPSTTCGTVYASCPTVNGVEFQYGLFYASSVDRGVTWCNRAGSTCTTALAKIVYPWSAYQLESTDTRMNTEYSWDIGPDGDIYILALLHDGDAGDLTGGQVDWIKADPDTGKVPVPTITIIPSLIRYARNGTRTVTALDAGGNSVVHYALFSGAYGELVALRASPGVSALAYRRSMDHGVTWTPAWTVLAGASANDRDLSIYRDDLDRGLIHLLYADAVLLASSPSVWYRSMRMWR